MNPMTLGYSPCPNDTFIFHALTHGAIDTKGLSFKVYHEDVETLNQWAVEGRLAVTKLSFAALGRVLEQYALLRTGAALGRGCGPILVAPPDVPLDRVTGEPVTIAIPGEMTTAFLLLTLFMPSKAPFIAVHMTFDQIMPAVAEGRVDCGLVIHEGRFTYEEYGLVSLVDLGAWWEEETHRPIPLGGIAIRRDVPADTVMIIEQLIGESLSHAWAHPDESVGYIRKHAQEMAPDVIRQHIGLYVNPFSRDLGAEGTEAIETLFKKAAVKGVISSELPPLFACVSRPGMS